MASKGKVVGSVLERVLADPFFRQPPPRSTGRERFGSRMVREVVAEVERALGEKLVPGEAERGWPHVLATLTALTSRSIGDAYREWVIPRGVEEVFLMGGGGGVSVFNSDLCIKEGLDVSRLSEATLKWIGQKDSTV